jgi:hypothetical protein
MMIMLSIIRKESRVLLLVVLGCCVCVIMIGFKITHIADQLAVVDALESSNRCYNQYFAGADLMQLAERSHLPMSVRQRS